MRLPIAPAIFAAAFIMVPAVIGHSLVSAQDFSITNKVEPPADAGRRDLMRQLQAWWDVHGYYPRHASNNDEGGIVKVHLQVLPDGRIWQINLVESSGSHSLDQAGLAVFRSGFVKPLPVGSAEVAVDLSLNYILAHRHDEPVATGYVPILSKRPFTITNEPVKSPILETMLQRTCTGEVVKQGVRNHPAYGQHYWAQAIFFRKPDGTPWVKFYEGGFGILAPVTEVGKFVEWVGREERTGLGASNFTEYTVWADGENKLVGNIGVDLANNPNSINRGGTVDFTCASETVPAINWNAWSVNDKIRSPLGDPP